MKKSIICLLVTLVLLVAAFAVTTIDVSAAPEAGTLTSNAIKLTDGKWHTKYWTNANYDLNCYNKIVVPSKGYITFTATKPYDDEGEIGTYSLTLYKSDGTEVWYGSTSDQKNSFSEYYTVKIGLPAGTYFLNIDPSFYVYTYSAPIESKYKFTFTKNNYWEVEDNDNKASATQMTLGKKYTGISASGDKDYFKVKLTKGKFYKLTIGNSDDLGYSKNFYDPKGNEVSLYDLKESGNSEFMIFKAAYSGWYYFEANPYSKVQYTVTVANHTKKTQTISGPSKITRYGFGSFSIGKKYSAKTELSYSSSSSKMSVWDSGSIYPEDCCVATVVVKAKETDYYKAATKKVTIVINPEGAPINSVSNNNRGGLKVKYNNPYYSGVSTQIQIATNSKFTKGVKNYYITNGDDVKTITNLKAGTKYYVRVRNFDTVNGKKYFSKWSKTLSKKVTVSVPTAKISSAHSWSWDNRDLEVDWSEASGVTGYQVQIATNSKFTQNKKIKTITGNDYDDTEYTFTKLKYGKKYYARVRAFVKTGGKTYYGKWSKVKSDIVE